MSKHWSEIHNLFADYSCKLLVVCALCVFSLFGNYALAGNDEVAEEMVRLSIDFPINKHEVSRDFSNNATALDSIAAILARTQADTLFNIKSIEVTGAASPDGILTKNLALAKRRMLATCAYLTNTYQLPDGISITPGKSYVPWDEFRALVDESGIPEARRVIEIASRGSDDSNKDALARMTELKRINGSRTWRYLRDNILPRLRRAVVLTLTLERFPAPEPPVVEETLISEAVAEVQEEPVAEAPAVSAPAPAPCPGGWHLSTNLIEWGMAISNLTAEVDFAPRWSAALSLHYSGMNYGRKTRKFRTFIFRPEVRWWAGRCHKGLFVDAHLQMAAFNFALPSWQYRIQDVGGKNPALGGGLGIGYRLPLGRNGHWAAQGQVGFGVYHLYYNRFENRNNGPLVDARRRVWAGIDNVAVSVVYNFNASGR